MELLTDVFAIAGWALFGFVFPAHLAILRNGDGAIIESYYCTISSMSFGLIAASLVLW